MTKFTESDVEAAALEWLQEIGYTVVGGPDIAPGEPTAERESYRDVILAQRVRDALARLNPTLPQEALNDAFRQITRTESPNLVTSNHRFHRLLIDGVPVSYQGEGRTIYTDARVLDFPPPGATPGATHFQSALHLNDFLAVNQFSVRKEGTLADPDAPLLGSRRPDVILFVNGLPLAVIELKNPADESATTYNAYQQLQTYKSEIPGLFVYNEALIASDGTDARMGTLTSGWEWFKSWREPEETGFFPKNLVSGCPLETLIKGVLAPERFLDLIHYFTVFEEHRAETIKKVAGYHQYHAANKAVAATLRATAPNGDGRVGVVWHTQGSGKSLTMLFYAGKVIQEPDMANPTLVVLTDRNDLDEQLFDTFATGHELLRQRPVQEDEIAFYDALANNQSAVKVMGDEQLAFIARELIEAVRQNVSIDWTVKQSARARIRIIIKRILRRHGYPPDLQEAATNTVLEQAELLAADWVG